MNNPILKFGTDISYGCQLDPKNARDLETFCNDPQLEDFEIFKNLEGMKYFGEYGNANRVKKNNWKAVTESSWEASVFDRKTESCDIYANANYKIYWAEEGYEENPQKYIISIEKSHEKETWQMRDMATRKFSLNVSFQFI